ncbi:MAG TPA: hypothetical protein VJ571_04455 [Candidatus Nitrosotalea sp.]|nr:hypothetical protein [Candidatus Nitrosotalea sp.]
MAQIYIRDETIDRIEKITGKKFTRGGDKLINAAFDLLERENSRDKVYAGSNSVTERKLEE